MTVIDIIFWLMYTMKITILIINQKTTIVCSYHMSWRRRKRNDIFWKYTRKALYSCVFNIHSTSNAWEMLVINIIFWLMYTIKTTITYINEKLLLFVGCRFHEKRKRGLVIFETSHKMISIHMFLTSIAQANIGKYQ